ncbi:hypothetical protein EGT07_01715 [Herbaspirillum sp. HC18]|nr:hypothetical protein EGT07_01715 [Herbaspirillum sp. HC18]
MKCLAVLFATVALAGCAAYQPVPKDYVGPTAIVRDTGGYIDYWTKAQVFSITEVDGQRIMDSFRTSDKASKGHGFTLNLDLQEQLVPAKPMTVKLRGSHITGAPIHAIASKANGTYFTVEGVVSFTPKADTRYRVKGELKREGSSVWIEEESSGQIVTEKVVEH